MQTIVKTVGDTNMGQTMTVADLWEQWRTINEEIENLKYRRAQLDEEMQEAVEERNEIVRQIEAEQGEIDWGW